MISLPTSWASVTDNRIGIQSRVSDGREQTPYVQMRTEGNAAMAKAPRRSHNQLHLDQRVFVCRARASFSPHRSQAHVRREPEPCLLADLVHNLALEGPILLEDLEPRRSYLVAGAVGLGVVETDIVMLP